MDLITHETETRKVSWPASQHRVCTSLDAERAKRRAIGAMQSAILAMQDDDPGKAHSLMKLANEARAEWQREKAKAIGIAAKLLRDDDGDDLPDAG